MSGRERSTFPPTHWFRDEWLLCNLRLLRDDDRHDQVHNRDPAKAREKCEDSQQTDNRGVNTKVIAQACTYPRDHPVGRTASQLFRVCVHDALLSMISM